MGGGAEGAYRLPNNSASEVEAVLAHGLRVAEPSARGGQEGGRSEAGQEGRASGAGSAPPAEEKGAHSQGNEGEGKGTAAGPDEVQPIQHVFTHASNKLPV